ncbi:hypothetical protein M2323_003882 [Rhodoblastus acidophilus]|uniref:hypothetical protein n=1 Tax=Rhodoblastus acidophilus TaxID=1074 RepID=UPI00222507E1|nr:hypothetical protein [Rhodoblastus acidophilus]MCW2286045.1 hypothetical protein [Rhodoblastus acidophilus]MCW2334939.1 hypothetical protein [Rhodoblastus acidophilus]
MEYVLGLRQSKDRFCMKFPSSCGKAPPQKGHSGAGKVFARDKHLVFRAAAALS